MICLWDPVPNGLSLHGGYKWGLDTNYLLTSSGMILQVCGCCNVLVADVIDSHPKIEEGHKKKDDGKKEMSSSNHQFSGDTFDGKNPAPLGMPQKVLIPV